ncbi:MAG: tRNA glutamyl-Q(34) synthetase GluQRS [Micavibrio aeruginosavorus]|uniref:tRNA glutamyl-Q(34) synthetase GluQRS n=1 Tax=Micavibrio aeruginosavorus TaxID=349221 RepID=A0A7T5R1N9_9BACT|nr:MAG: tRNA glutamyl-Q(34) synthetase GluQRS [Micavibrio aeruginosavorus]
MTAPANKNMVVTRFAPSPTGWLHLGHAYSAVFAHNKAKEAGGRFLLRIEDIDPTRCTAPFENGIYEDLHWLGLRWEEPVRRQSDYMDDFKAALSRLHERGLLYPCFCSRKDIQEEIARSGYAPHGPEGMLYPGTCRHLSADEQAQKMQSGIPYAFRLDMAKALACVKGPLFWHDREKGEQRATPGILGDVVLARKDVATSYHLSVTVDDHLQGVTLVTRGEDLFYATHLHRLLQHLLDLNVPDYHHHGLMLDDQGKRFAKRNQSVTLRHLREVEKKSPQDVMKVTGIYLLSMAAVFFIMTVPANAQTPAEDPPATLEQQATRQVLRSPKKSFVTFSLENDSIGSGRDEDYTNGTRITYFDAQAAVPDIIHSVAGHIPTFSINQTTSVFYTLGQNLYTPSDITIREDVPGDRPWAAWLYLSAGLVTVTDNHADELELTAGIVGPAAAGEPVQRVVHEILGASTPKGWDNQLHNEPGLIASWNRRWPAAYSFSQGGYYAAVEPHIGLTAGNIYTYASSGITFYLTPDNGGLQDVPPRVRPAIPGTGFFATPDDSFGWYVFAGMEGRAVARNIFLDGNSFRDSPRIDKEPLVGDATLGLAATWDDIRVSYSVTYRTREFHGQDEGSLFGSVSLGYRY